MKVCESCNKQHNGTQRLCQECLLDETVAHSPLSTIDETVEIEDSDTTSTTYQNNPIPPISPINNNILYNRYEIVKEIGKGGMGTVYLAKDLRLDGKEVAIKEVTLNTTESKVFVDEAKMLVQLEHSNLPKITDYYPPNDSGQTYLVMDYIKGGTLSQIFEEKNYVLPTEQIMKYAIQLCNLLDYLHSHNPPIIYRDLKPSNIMIDENDNVQLIDFGIARKYKEGKHGDTVLFGTEKFAAPEQFMANQQTDHRTDLYSFGATLYYLFTGGQYYNLLKKPLNQVNTKLTQELCDIINKLLEYEPQKRYQSSKELKDILIKLRVIEKTKELPAAKGNKNRLIEPAVERSNNTPAKPNDKTKKAKSSSSPKKVKRFMFFILFMAIVIGGGYGSFKYLESQNSALTVIERFEQAIVDEDAETIASLLTTDDSRLTIDEQSVQHLVQYFKVNPSELKVFIKSLKQQEKNGTIDSVYSNFSIVEGEKLYYLIDTYKIDIEPVYVSVKANRKDTMIVINEKEVGSTETEIYEQSFGPFIPGQFHVEAIWTSDLTTLKDSQTVGIFSDDNNEALEFDLTGESISISANYQSADIVVNGEPVGTTIAETPSFGPILTDGSMTVYVQQSFPWGTVRSKEQTITGADQLLFEIDPMTNELQEMLFSIGNTYIESVLETYRTKDLTVLKHVNADVTNIYNNMLVQLQTNNETSIGTLKSVKYDLDSLDFYENTSQQYETIVNVSFQYDATVPVTGAGTKQQTLTEHQKLTFLYDETSSQWMIKDVIFSNEPALTNFKEYTF